MKFLTNVPLNKTKLREEGQTEIFEINIQVEMTGEEFKEYENKFKKSNLAEIEITNYPRCD